MDQQDLPTVPLRPVAPVADGPTRAVPEMFATEMVPFVGGPPHAWSQAPDAGGSAPPGLFPGWTGVHPAVGSPAAAGVMAPRPERRRRAFYAVLAVAVLTVVVLLVALQIAPHWGGKGSVADKVGQPTPVVASDTAGLSGRSSSPGTDLPGTTASLPVPPPVRTVTVTAAPSTVPTASTDRGAPTATAGGGSTGRRGPSPVKPTPKRAASTRAATTPASVTPAATPPLGVAEREIVCNPGYIVQLASEFDPVTFKARVARLRAAGQLPVGSAAADAVKSCRLFSSQTNSFVLYTGPYPSKYAGCPARLSGPADAYIKGSTPGSSSEFVSCLCPATSAGLPRYQQVGQQGVWIGELQRILGARLNIGIPDLTGRWGILTPGTRSAVQRFQVRANLPANGFIDDRTWQAVQSAAC